MNRVIIYARVSTREQNVDMQLSDLRLYAKARKLKVVSEYIDYASGAKKGYNPKKPGSNSHHPLIAFVAEVRMTVNFWLRSGNSYTTNNFYSFH